MQPWFQLPERWVLAVKKVQYYFGLSITATGALVGFSGLFVLFFKSGSWVEPDKLIALSRLIIGASAMGVGVRLVFSTRHHLRTRSLDDDAAYDNPSIHTDGGNYNEFISGNYNEFISGDYIQGDYISIRGDYISMDSDLSEVANQILEIVSSLKAEGHSKENAQQIVAEELATHARSNRAVKVKLRKWRRSLDNVAVKTPVLEVANAVFSAASNPDTMPDNFSPNLSTKYSRLEALLRAKNWEEADEETAGVIIWAYLSEEQKRQLGELKGLECLKKLKEFDWKEQEEFYEEEEQEESDSEELEGFDSRDIANYIKMFPGRDLRHINNLWVKYSGGRFGFSVQKNIWKEILKGYNYFNHNDYDFISLFGNEIYDKFGDRVGWRVEGDWILYSDISYHQNAPSGHLPVTVMMLSDFCYSNSCSNAKQVLRAFVSRQYKVY